MADDDVTTEQLAAIAAENEEPEPVNYKPPAQKSVKEIHELDKDDESLRKYKEALLGSGISEAGNTLCVSECVCNGSAKPQFKLYLGFSLEVIN